MSTTEASLARELGMSVTTYKHFIDGGVTAKFFYKEFARRIVMDKFGSTLTHSMYTGQNLRIFETATWEDVIDPNQPRIAFRIITVLLLAYEGGLRYYTTEWFTKTTAAHQGNDDTQYHTEWIKDNKQTTSSSVAKDYDKYELVFTNGNGTQKWTQSWVLEFEKYTLPWIIKYAWNYAQTVFPKWYGDYRWKTIDTHLEMVEAARELVKVTMEIPQYIPATPMGPDYWDNATHRSLHPLFTPKYALNDTYGWMEPPPPPDPPVQRPPKRIKRGVKKRTSPSNAEIRRIIRIASNGAGKGGRNNVEEYLNQNIHNKRLMDPTHVRISRPVYEETRKDIYGFVEKIVTGAIAYQEHRNRKTNERSWGVIHGREGWGRETKIIPTTITASDVLFALKKNNMTLYGYGH